MINKTILAVAIATVTLSVNGYAAADKLRPIFHGSLNSKIKDQKISDDTSIDVIIALKAPKSDRQLVAQSSEMESDESGVHNIKINGKSISKTDHDAMVESKSRSVDQKRLDRKNQHRQMWQKISQKADGPLFNRVQKAIDNGDSSVRLKLKKRDLSALPSQYGEFVAGVEEVGVEANEASIFDVREWTRVENDAFDEGAKGGGVGVYVKEVTNAPCPTADELGFPATTYFKEPGTSDGTAHGKNVISIINAVAPEADIYCGANSLASNNSEILAGTAAPDIEPVFVATHSWSTSNSVDADGKGIYTAGYKSVDRDLGNEVYDFDQAVFVAAGNYGATQEYVSSPGKDFNVITVGNASQTCGQDGGPFQLKCWSRNASSSWKNPETGAEKPEISAPGTSITAGGYTMTGTSMASPHAAGMAADIMSANSYFKLRPAALKAAMLASARDKIDKNTTLANTALDMAGVGVINYRNFKYTWKNKHWSGGNSAYFDSNEEVIYTTALDASQTVRAALVWLNNPEYTYENKKIGMDLDLYVYAPDGSLVGSSKKRKAGYQYFDFSTTTSGTYKFKLKRVANNDVGGKVNMSIHVEYSGIE